MVNTHVPSTSILLLPLDNACFITYLFISPLCHSIHPLLTSVHYSQLFELSYLNICSHFHLISEVWQMCIWCNLNFYQDITTPLENFLMLLFKQFLLPFSKTNIILFFFLLWLDLSVLELHKWNNIAGMLRCPFLSIS